MKKQIIFVCTGNTCRSVLAEWLSRRRFDEKAVFTSAGIRPGLSDDASNAVHTLRAHFGIEVTHTPRDVRDFDLSQFDYVVAMDKPVAKTLTISKDKLVVWNIDDPFGDDLEEYRRCALLINRELEKLRL